MSRQPFRIGETRGGGAEPPVDEYVPREGVRGRDARERGPSGRATGGEGEEAGRSS